MAELKITAANFNDEVLHAILVNKAPKYGNDIEEADQTARNLGQYLCNAISRRKHLSGAPLRPGLFSFLQFMNGENCAARSIILMWGRLCET